jgi:Bacterial membrane protein YfhO
MTPASRVRGASLTSARERIGRPRFLVAVGLALAALGLLVYRDFVFGGSTLLYKDIGSDSLNVFYPNYVLRSEYLRNVGLFSWSFQVGMGQNIFPSIGNLLLAPVIWLPKEAIAKALVYQHLFYVLVCGLLFARFLADRGLTFSSSLLGSLLLSFSAYMCMGSCWYFHAYEVVCFAILLFAVEAATGRGRWPYLVLGVAAVGLLGSFHLYLCALFLCFYVPVRLTGRFPRQPLPLFRVSLLLAGAALLGVGLSAIVSMGNFYALVNSPRGSGPTSMFHVLSSVPVFGFESPLHYTTAILRIFANDMVGTGSDFRGWQNYLEAPMSYCGLLCLLLFPQVFRGATLRQRLIYGLFTIFLVLPVVFPWFRYLFFAFQGDYYRTFSLFSIFGLITLSVTALSRYSKGAPLNLWVLGITLCLLLGTLLAPSSGLHSLTDPHLRWIAAILLIAYVVLLVGGQLMKRPSMAGWIVAGLAAGELIYFDGITISRPTVTKHELKARVGYNDETVDAVRDIKASDHSFFRLTKTWGSSPASANSASLNDALVFGYYGTSSYSSFNNLNYITFLIATDVISHENIAAATHWSMGLLGHPILSTFACEKYVLTGDPVAFQTAGPYEEIGRYGETYLFRNRMFVPLGLTFTRYISESDFQRLPSAAKEQALLYAVVLSPKNAADHLLPPLSLEALRDEINGSAPEEIIGLRRKTGLNIQSFKETRISGTVTVDGKAILVFQTPFDPGWRAVVDKQPAATIEVDGGLLGVALSGGEHAVEMRYVPPFRSAGATISLLSFILLGLLAWKWPRMDFPA